MNLQFEKIKKDIKRFKNFLKINLVLEMNTSEEKILDIYMKKGKLNIEYINSLNNKPVTVTYKGEENLYNTKSIKNADDIYKTKIANIIKNYKDEIEENYDVKLVRIDKFLKEKVYTYKMKRGLYLYTFKKFKIIANEEGLIDIYKKDKQTKRDNMSSIENVILEDTLILNKKLISKEMNIPKININGEEYLNVELIKNNIEKTEKYKNRKRNVDRMDAKSEETFGVSLLSILIFTISSFVLVFTENEKILTASLILSVFSLILTFALLAIAQCATLEKEYLEEKEYKYQEFFKANKDKMYVRKKDIECFLKEYDLLDMIDMSFQKPSLQDNEKTPIEHGHTNVSSIDYNIRCERSKGINALLRELEKRGLDRDYPLIYSYYIPEVIEFEKVYDLSDEENKKNIEKSIKLLENKLKQILEEDNKQNNMNLKAKIEAFNNSFK